MSVLKAKRIVLGVSGGIAAYKSTFLVRLLIKCGAEVRVILTPEAENFVTPLSLSTLSKNPVFSSLYDEHKTWYNHVEIGEWADLMIIAPATANTISKMVDGSANNLLLTTYLSAKCPVYIAPAMDLDMYQHPSTKENLRQLESFGNIIIPATSGELASGLVGQGRMAEPEDIIAMLEEDLLTKLPLKGKKFLITAGPTHEPIDPVRFIGNHSSGKMGIALAKTAADLGAHVHLVLGPSHFDCDHSLIQVTRVQTAEEMFQACTTYFPKVDVFIASAAVADYRPKRVASEKIKKSGVSLNIELLKNPDILSELGNQKKHQFVVGFALETENEIENAKQKLQKKNLDAIVLNSLKVEGAGFQTDTNKISIITAQQITEYPLKPKAEVAKDIIDYIQEYGL